MGRLTRSLPNSVKQLAPVVRERDLLRAKVLELRAQLQAEHARRSAPAPRLHGGYVGDGRVLVGPKWGGRVLLRSDDLTLLPDLMTEGTYDVPFTAFVQRYVKPGDTVVEVGANVGLFTLLMAFGVGERGRVVAYEADSQNAEFLRDNVVINGLGDRVEIVPATAETLDVLAGRFERIDLIKLAVEGAEEQLSAGMAELLESGIVRCVSFELARDLRGDDGDPFKERLRGLESRGWTFATLTDAGEPEPIELDAVFERGQFSPVLMTPKPSGRTAPAPTPTRARAVRPALEFPSGWDDWHRRRLVAERFFLPWIEQVLPLEGRTVLEYGAGNGPVTAAFAPVAGRYIGIDIDEAEIDVSRRLLDEAGLHPELHASPPSEILEATAAFRGEVDVFLCAAVLEHMSGAERLALLQLARDVVRPDGIIVVFETPNRLTPWDYHTSRLPFLNQVPEDVALAYLKRSPRSEFVASMQAAAARGSEAEQEAYVRWGRGMSYHVFELVFDDLPRHVVASSWDPLLLAECDVHREEVALQRVLDDARPDLPPAFSRYWLDFILAATPRDTPASFLRPWPLRTTGSRDATYDESECVHLDGPGAVLAVELPSPSARLVVGSEHLDTGRRVSVRQRSTGKEATGTLSPGKAAYSDLHFDEPATSYDVSLDAPGLISLVLYER